MQLYNFIFLQDFLTPTSRYPNFKIPYPSKIPTNQNQNFLTYPAGFFLPPIFFLLSFFWREGGACHACVTHHEIHNIEDLIYSFKYKNHFRQFGVLLEMTTGSLSSEWTILYNLVCNILLLVNI